MNRIKIFMFVLVPLLLILIGYFIGHQTNPEQTSTKTAGEKAFESQIHEYHPKGDNPSY